jgi:ABC-type cobalamin/Fe3+-siderophores transport system ATPase subunit
MWIQSFRIQNYMSLRDTDTHELSQHMNVVVGQNNSGKTALLKSIAMRLSNDPHRSLIFPKNHVYDPISTGEFEFVANGTELESMLLAGGQVFHVPMETSARGGQPRAQLRQFFSREQVRFRVKLVGSNWSNIIYPSHQIFTPPSTDRLAVRAQANPSKSDFTANFVDGGNDEIGVIAGAQIMRRTYFFDAQRLNVGRHLVGNRTELLSNAANLAEVLLVLQHNRRRFDRLNQHLREIFPTINSISVRPAEDSGNTAEIKVWSVDPATERDDLAIPLDKSGTGIGQVIAILYVVLASESNVVVIDEPNSFLHPSASRQLIAVLRQYPNHQYIISTHSPETLAGARPDKLFVLRWQAGETKISVLPGEDVRSVQEALIEVGSRLSDVFGADAVIWVEGPTEEACFPRILKAAGIDLGNTVSIVALRNTGDLQAKRGSAEAMWDVYQRLSRANSLLPRAIAFSLDREIRNSKRMGDLERLSRGLIRFTPRRMLENYLIHAKAITQILNRLPTFRENPISEVSVQKWVDANKANAAYFTGDLKSGDDWITDIDAAEFLTDLFAAVSDAKESYHKVGHAVELTDWILANDHSHLDELIAYVVQLVPEDVRQQRTGESLST